MSTPSQAQEAFNEAKLTKPEVDEDKHLIGHVDGWTLLQSKLTDMRFAAHASSGRFFHNVDGGQRMRSGVPSAAPLQDRPWLTAALAREGWVIRDGGKTLSPPPAKPAMASVPVVHAPLPLVRRKTTRLVIVEHVAEVTMDAWSVRRALASVGVTVPDAVELTLHPEGHGALTVRWTERTEKEETS